MPKCQGRCKIRFSPQEMKLNSKNAICFFRLRASLFTRGGCHFMRSGSHIQVCSLKNERVAVSDSTRQTCPWRRPVILDTVYRQSRCAPHRPASPQHTLFTARSSSRHVTRARRKSAHSERESGQLLFLAAGSFSRAGVKQKPKSHL